MRSNGSDDPRTFVSSARRAQIVEAAIETVAEVGYANASLSRIAVRLGISKGVISYHFAGKDDLIAEIVSQVLQRARAYMQPRIEAQTTGPEMLRAYIESNLEFIRDNPESAQRRRRDRPRDVRRRQEPIQRQPRRGRPHPRRAAHAFPGRRRSPN